MVALGCGSGESGGSDAGPDGGIGDDSGIGDNEIKIRRDEHGIPHIEAATDEGAMRGLGYASAQDRLLHMNLMALAVQGRLSSVLGRVPVGNSDSVALDRRMRTFGYWRHAQAVAPQLPADTLALLEAYAAGVNEYVADNGVPTELMTTVGIEHQTWTVAHVLAMWHWVGSFFAPDGMNKAAGLHTFEAEVAAVGIDAAIEARLCGQPAGDPSVAVVQLADVPSATVDAMAAYATSVGQTPQSCPGSASANSAPMYYDHVAPKFSHAWVVGGQNTTTGAAVLVSDPQTPVSFPAIWYEFAISGDTIEARGVGLPGNPTLLIGWNQTLAWGATAAGIDQSDLFRIDVRGPARDQYLLDGVATDMITATETIDIAGEPAQTVTYRETVFGPMVTEFVSDTQGEEFAARYFPFAGGSTDTVVSSIAAMRATTLEELDAAFDGHQFPTLNLLAGDSDGNVFYRLVGSVPVRSQRSPLGGSIAQEGDSVNSMWQDIVPGSLMPKVTNPSGGNILSGNHRPVADWYPISLGLGTGSKGDTHRSARVRELLEALPAQATPEQVFDLVQFDCVEVGRRDVVMVGQHLSGMGMLSANADAAVAALSNWLAAGGQNTVTSDGAFLATFLGNNFRLSDTGPAMQAIYGGGENGYMLWAKTMREAIAADPGFVPSAADIAYVDTLLSDAFTSASAVPQAQWQTQMQDAATVSLDHFALLGTPEIGTAQAGTVNLTCNLGSTVWSQGAQSYTQWIDLADVDSSRAMMPIGNTEQLSAATSQSQAGLWATGDLRAAPLSPAAFEAITSSTVTLEVP